MHSAPAAAALRPAAAPATRPVAWWLFLCAAMVFAMAVIGAITRLTESGLSIVEWAPIKGALPPLSDQAWQDAFAAYKATPEYLYKNTGMSLEAFQQIFFWEWLHRLWGRLIGLVFAAGLAWFWWRGGLDRGLRLRLLGLLVLGGLQGALGWFMVMSGLVDRPSVSHYRLAAHLGLAVLLYALILWTAYGLVLPRLGSFAGARSLRRHASIAIGCVAVTMCWGAFVAGLDAGQVYNTFPLMDGRLLPPPESFSIIPAWLNWFDNTALVQFTHRWLAIGTSLRGAGPRLPLQPHAGGRLGPSGRADGGGPGRPRHLHFAGAGARLAGGDAPGGGAAAARPAARAAFRNPAGFGIAAQMSPRRK